MEWFAGRKEAQGRAGYSGPSVANRGFDGHADVRSRIRGFGWFMPAGVLASHSSAASRHSTSPVAGLLGVAYTFVDTFGYMILGWMMGTTVRINKETHSKLRALAESAGESMPELLEKAVEAYRRQRLLDETNLAFAALRKDPAEWQAELDERQDWDTTLSDGIQSEAGEGH
jgi:hypothetical protein